LKPFSCIQIEDIARVCHEANRAYCLEMGDASQVPWNEAPTWQRDSARLGVQLHLANDVGPEGSHESWMAQKIADGWQYGPDKDAEKKLHPCLVPFEQLPFEQQFKDRLFHGIVHIFKTAQKELAQAAAGGDAAV
jgi:hypothetical protein